MGHDSRADIAVDSDLDKCAGAQGALDELLMSGAGQTQQLLVAVGQMVILVVRDHPDSSPDVRSLPGVLAQSPHLL
jgi:hypothetical protein